MEKRKAAAELEKKKASDASVIKRRENTTQTRVKQATGAGFQATSGDGTAGGTGSAMLSNLGKVAGMAASGAAAGASAIKNRINKKRFEKKYGEKIKSKNLLNRGMISKEEFYDWREEFIQEVEKKAPEEKKKIIDVMKGKNVIEINPVTEGKDYCDCGCDCGKKICEECGKPHRPENVKEGAGLAVARAIDKTNPPLGRPSRRRAVSTALRMREIMKDTEKNKKRKFSGKAAVAEGAAWTKKEGKNKSGGLNEKGRKSYERENPGSDLKAPSKKVGNPRRKSFCARMKGMKKKLTSSKTANDPDSRINKSLRAWNC